jgi:uncharacterized protein YbdZ (MbtH family)
MARATDGELWRLAAGGEAGAFGVLFGRELCTSLGPSVAPFPAGWSS